MYVYVYVYVYYIVLLYLQALLATALERNQRKKMPSIKKKKIMALIKKNEKKYKNHR